MEEAEQEFGGLLCVRAEAWALRLVKPMGGEICNPNVIASRLLVRAA